MSDIAVRADQHLEVPTATEPATAQLVQWAQAAHAAGQFAAAVCNTSAVPAAYKGKPAEAAAAILAGAEVGLSPMASLRAFHSINGTPAPAAITLRAIVQGLGHTIEIVESDDRHCVVRGKRKDSDEWQHNTWTIERAQQAGYVSKNPRWKADPKAQLVARATSEMARWIASDAIMGMPYTAEEIRDQGVTVEARPAPRLVTAADFLETTETAEPAFTVADALEEIAAAPSQNRLDEIKAVCRDNGIRDPQVLDAWAARSAELAEAA